MTIQNVVAFGNLLNTDEALRQELLATIKGMGPDESAEATADLAASKGLEVTAAEVKEGYSAVVKMQDGKQDELSDNELEIVSGGKGESVPREEHVSQAINTTFDGYLEYSPGTRAFTELQKAQGK